ncbi:MAG: Riboflavin biosynthesis protein RibF [Tenericutes bacterium ADurb.Bin087]|nr:MAG: Riboflavin biosynthesis protein RibF [Tenericutes bacterium ADurb.Bin087]
MIAKHLDLKNIKALDPNTALVLGTFDGVHAGHRYLITHGKMHHENVAVLLIYTNKKMTKAHQKSGVLTTLEDRIKIFAELGVQSVYLLNLDEELLKLEPRAFVSAVLVPLAPSEVIVGTDFRFGAGAKGTGEDLAKFGHNYFVTTLLKPLYYEETKVSTSLIKELLLAGKPAVARSLLGRYYTLAGLVTKGYGLGNKLGFPTANIALDPSYFVPAHGVYFVRVKFKDKDYFGMASLGYHPTVNKVKVPLLEVNIFDFNDSIYHDVLVVEFIDYLRPEVKFASVDELIMQLKKDRENCELKIKRGTF